MREREALRLVMARILVADDAALLRVLACRSFEVHRTVEAQDGHEALALVYEHCPDIVILDWMMPGLSGVEVTRAIRIMVAKRRAKRRASAEAATAAS